MVNVLNHLHGREVIEIRFHGRGGQGAVTAANILVVVAYKNGLWGQAFPFFGAERRGAPVLAFARISRRRVRRRSMIRTPDVVVVLDDKLPMMTDVLKGLKRGGSILINTEDSRWIERLGINNAEFHVYIVNATKIALELGLKLAGWPLVNTAMVGALAKILGFPLNTVEESIVDYLGYAQGKKNLLAAKRAYEEVIRIE